jgi:hypothetical protein
MSLLMLACPLAMIGLPGVFWIGSRLSRSRENAPFRPMCVPTVPSRRPDLADGADSPGVTADGVAPHEA